MPFLDRATPPVKNALLELAASVDRARVTARVTRDRGVLRTMRPAGVRVLLEAAVQGKRTPSTMLRVHAKNQPTKLAIRWRDQTYTWGEIDELVDRLASGLRRAGATKGSSAVLMMKNRPEFLLMQWAMGRLGGSAVSVSWRSTAAELEYLVKHSGSKLVIFDADVGDTVSAAEKGLGLPHTALFAVGGASGRFRAFEELVAKTPDDVADASDEAAVVIYTSGTTGKPKGAVRKFPKEALAQALRFIELTPLAADDVHLAVCPLYHSTAFGFAALTFLLGGTVVIGDHFEPESFLRDVERYRVSSSAVVPTMLHRLMSVGKERLRAFDTTSLKAIFSGGAPLSAPLAIEVMNALGDVVFNFYGATETGLVTLATPQDLREAPGTIGRAVPGNDIRLLDDRGNAVGPGEVGELFVKNTLLVEGYHKDEGATKSSMNAGYFSVGDLARVDAAGRYHIEGRKRDMIISGGVNVYPAEVEQALEQHPDVAEVAVVGAPDSEWGERVRAFVVKRPGAQLDDMVLKAFCKERLSGPKQPKEYVFLDALPRNPTGKVLKRELREWRPKA